jgi:hypothetical protein
VRRPLRIEALACVAALITAALLGSACGPRGDAQDVDIATSVAEKFLRALDAGDSRETWRELASPLRSAVPEAEWPAQIARIRAPLGRPVAHQLVSATFTEALADAPPGRYFVVEFESQFADASAGERVVPMFENGAWRVSGYFVLNTKPERAPVGAP